MKYSKCTYCGTVYTGNDIPSSCIACGAPLPLPEYAADIEEFKTIVQAAQESSILLETAAVQTRNELKDLYSDLQKKCNTARIINQSIAEQMMQNKIGHIKKCQRRALLFAAPLAILIPAFAFLLFHYFWLTAFLAGAGFCLITTLYCNIGKFFTDCEKQSNAKFLKVVNQNENAKKAINDYERSRIALKSRLQEIKDYRPALCDLTEYKQCSSLCGKGIDACLCDDDDYSKTLYEALLMEYNVNYDYDSFISLFGFLAIILGIIAFGVEI